MHQRGRPLRRIQPNPAQYTFMNPNELGKISPSFLLVNLPRKYLNPGDPRISQLIALLHGLARPDSGCGESLRQ
jgi:hypothetical protein